MINLLSQEYRSELAAAKRNIVLRKYVFTLVALVAVVAASYSVGYILLQDQKQFYEAQKAEYEPQKSQYATTIKEAADYNKNLAIAKSILSNEIVFSHLMITITQLIPSNVLMSNVSLKANQLDKTMELTFGVNSAVDAVAVKNAFEKSPYFKDTKIKTIDIVTDGPTPFTTVIITSIKTDVYIPSQREATQ